MAPPISVVRKSSPVSSIAQTLNTVCLAIQKYIAAEEKEKSKKKDGKTRKTRGVFEK